MKYRDETNDPKNDWHKYLFQETCSARKKNTLPFQACRLCLFWGAKLDTLALKYTIYIRPRTEDLPQRSHRQKSQIDKGQNTTLRLITGSVKTTPISMSWSGMAKSSLSNSE